MTIDYYLVDRRHGRIFDVGCHRMSYNRALRMALSMQEPPAQEWFCLACAADAFGRVAKHPEGYVGGPWTWAFWAARFAANIHDFCYQARWDVELCHDCDDSLQRYRGLPETHTVYTLASVDGSPPPLFGPGGYFSYEQFRQWHPHLCCEKPGRVRSLNATPGQEEIQCVNCGTISKLQKVEGKKRRRWVRQPPQDDGAKESGDGEGDQR